MMTIFESQTTNNTNGASQLAKTAQLTNMAEQIMSKIWKICEDNGEQYEGLVKASFESHNAMDKLITTAYDLTTIDVSFLKEESAEDLDKMLRSQQSKRSRSKAMARTLENFQRMMTGAIAENLIRLAAGKPKSAVGGGAKASTVEYSEEMLAKLANDQEALKREIRNVQSKKSIMKSKADFDESSERWQQLLTAEEVLKGLRVSTVRVVDNRAEQIKEVLNGIDPSTLKAADAKELLAKIQSVITNEETVTEA